VVRSVTQRLRNRFNVAVAEIGGQDTWQRAVLGITATGIDRVRVRGVLTRVLVFIEELHLAEVTNSDIELLELCYEGRDDDAEGEDRDDDEAAPEE
jgi:uncharacterized protein YlxP (DUF503 family)